MLQKPQIPNRSTMYLFGINVVKLKSLNVNRIQIMTKPKIYSSRVYYRSNHVVGGSRGQNKAHRNFVRQITKFGSIVF